MIKYIYTAQIPVKVDLPVGQNLQDHISALVGPFTVKPGTSFLLDRDINLKSVFSYATGTGAFSDNALHGMGFHVSQEAKDAGEEWWPDIQFMFFAISIYNNGPRDFEKIYNVRSGVLHKYFQEVRGKDSFLIVTVLARPQSRGQVLLAGTDPNLPPLINPNYFQGERDMKALVEGKVQIYVY